jgi:hypothetical protein
MTLTDGPFDLRVPGVLDGYAEACEGWGETLAWLRGWVDFSVELRRAPPQPQPYRRGANAAAIRRRRLGDCPYMRTPAA